MPTLDGITIHGWLLKSPDAAKVRAVPCRSLLFSLRAVIGLVWAWRAAPRCPGIRYMVALCSVGRKTTKRPCSFWSVWRTFAAKRAGTVVKQSHSSARQDQAISEAPGLFDPNSIFKSI